MAFLYPPSKKYHINNYEVSYHWQFGRWLAMFLFLIPLFVGNLLHFSVNTCEIYNLGMHRPILTFLRFSSNICCWDKCPKIVPSRHCACSRSSSQYLLTCVNLALIRAASPVVINWAKDWASSSNPVMLLILLSISRIVT
jgi:hypothetical protein